ncbi:conserved membrane hypothetical protein [Paraburkholderia sabiae]|uniref:hypothetical protein n=1 Tax=Paraburkholderia sabiae TaxID=273251 RepID=UPI001CACA17B|nr:hypothetical protein [Paraburkholderia sabiae]CAG9225679.1 conserved membrane hypothetical protein [Paraburkholderia sabiae]
MVKDSTILLLQFTATLFMAADYFFDGKQRDKINGLIQRVTQPIHDSADGDMKDLIATAGQQWIGLFVALAFLIAALLANVFLKKYGTLLPVWFVITASLVFLMLLSGILPKLAYFATRVVVPFALAAGTRTIALFLLRCPKGSVFGIGFLILMTSFVCRVINLK